MEHSPHLSFKIKRDRFRKARGGSSTFLNVYCIHCRAWVLLYQKDGPGTLHRLYLDRIFYPEALAQLAKTVKTQKDYSGLHCAECAALLGIPMTYEKEQRLAFRIVPGSIVTKVGTGEFPVPPLSSSKQTEEVEDEQDSP